jgi:hypothetical protein
MNKNYLRNVVNEAYIESKAVAPRKAIMIDLYSGRAEIVPPDEIEEATAGLRRVKGQGGIVTYKGEEYLVVVA